MRRLLVWLVALLALAMAAGFLGTFHEVLDGIGSLRLHLVLAALALAALGELLGARPAVWLGILTGVVGLVGLGPVWRTETDARPGGVPVTLLVANLSDENDAPAALRAALPAHDADILVTVETTRRAIGDAAELDAAYPHRLRIGSDGDALRVAMWSRWPLARGEFYLNNNPTPTAARAVVTPPGARPFGVIGVHLSWPVLGKQKRQARGIGDIVDEIGLPVVVAGDFNATPWSHALALAEEASGARMPGGYRITWRGVYPTPLGDIPDPLGLQIDHVLTSPEIGLTRIEAVPVPGSDHLGLLVTLSVPAR